jgi:phosphatidylinositol glycan class Z
MFSLLWFINLSALIRRQQDALSRVLILRTLWASVLIPLAALSLAPHQEPRFLTPIILPMCVLAAYYTRNTASSIKWRLFAIWVTINALLACLFGVLHQGGVVRSMQTLAKPDATFDGDSSAHFALFWKTYSPPLSILARSSGKSDRVSIYDAAGASVDDVRDILLTATSTGVCVTNEPMCGNAARSVMIIAPALAFERLRDRTRDLDYECVFSIYPHLSLDHLDDVFDAFASVNRRERLALVKKSLELTAHRVVLPVV